MTDRARTIQPVRGVSRFEREPASMNTKMHGKRIQTVQFPAHNCQEGQDPYLHSNADSRLELSATYHGDHDEFWIVEIRDGKEVARFNPRFVEMIVWLPESENV
jgi:hypothetical protein